MEKRRHHRMIANNLQADISDGRGFFSGTVEDLSRFGMKLDGVHQKLDTQSNRLSIIVSGEGKHFKILAKPRWSRKKSFNKMVGLEILKAPLGWAEFVMKFEAEKHEIWGEIAI